MTNLNFQQKIAILRILLDIINADGRIDERETYFFDKVSKTLGITKEDRKYVNESNSLLCVVEINHFDDEQKKWLAELMGQLIVVDEDINVNEMAIYELVCKYCNIGTRFEEVVTDDQLKNSSRS